MKDFIAKFGYTLAWGLGIPKSFEENYDGFYRFGLLFISFSSILIVALTIMLIFIIKSEKGAKRQ